MNVPTGYTALDLVGFTDRGQYSGSASYVQNDLTHYGGSIWRCLVDDTTGIVPAEGANWTIFIAEPANMTEAIIAPIEYSPATTARSVGDQIIYNDVLYKVIAPIAVSDPLTVGTNIIAASKVVVQISATESMIAHIEYSTTASQAYAVGDYLLYDWTLYKVTTAITQGGTITTSGGSANVSATTIGAEISSLNSHIANLESGKVANGVVSAQDVETFGATAINSHAVGTYFLCDNGKNYKCTSAITGGSTTITASNATEAPIDGQLASINSNLSNTSSTATAASNKLAGVQAFQAFSNAFVIRYLLSDGVTIRQLAVDDNGIVLSDNNWNVIWSK